MVKIAHPSPARSAPGRRDTRAVCTLKPQLSTVDGRWDEGFNGHNGWAIAPLPGDSTADDDAGAADQLYELLETEVVPLYYTRDASDLPQRWIQVMRHALRSAGQHFTSRRTLMEYVRDYYVPSMRGETTADEAPTA